MVITEIKVQRKNKKRYSIFIDGQYRMSTGIETLTRFSLKEGDEISDEFVNDILKEDERERIKERLNRILSFRDRTPKELVERLTNLGYDNELVAEVIEDYVNNKVLDEERLIQSFIADYTNLNPKGNLFIKKQLLAKGIDRGLIDKYLKERDESTVARQFLERRASRIKNMDRAKIYRLLLNRGFTPRVASEVCGEES